MSNKRLTQIGLDRLLHLSWLEKVSSLVLAGNKERDIKNILQEDLKSAFRTSRTDVRGSIDKTITILIKIWVKPPLIIDPLRTDGLELLKRSPSFNHLAIHWGMVTAAYPFWSGVGMQVGRLLRLQDTASAAQVQRRVRELYGERETVHRRVRYVLRSYVDWGVLKEVNNKGIYAAGTMLSIDDSQLVAWVIEAALCARVNGSAPLRDLIDSPSLFPFKLNPIHAEILVTASPRLDVIRHGLDDDLIILRKSMAKGRTP